MSTLHAHNNFVGMLFLSVFMDEDNKTESLRNVVSADPRQETR